jgi:hypothetical protein
VRSWAVSAEQQAGEVKRRKRTLSLILTTHFDNPLPSTTHRAGSYTVLAHSAHPRLRPRPFSQLLQQSPLPLSSTMSRPIAAADRDKSGEPNIFFYVPNLIGTWKSRFKPFPAVQEQCRTGTRRHLDLSRDTGIGCTRTRCRYPREKLQGDWPEGDVVPQPRRRGGRKAEEGERNEGGTWQLYEGVQDVKEHLHARRRQLTSFPRRLSPNNPFPPLFPTLY